MRLYILNGIADLAFSVHVPDSSPTVADLRRVIQERKPGLEGKTFNIYKSWNGGPLKNPSSPLSDCDLRDGSVAYIADQDGGKITLDKTGSPGPPASIWITQKTKNSATVNWLPAPCDGDSPVDGYIVQYSGRLLTTWSEYITGTSHTIHDLEEGGEFEYFFWVTAENKSGFGGSGKVSCMVGLDFLPNNVQIQGIANNQVTLTWKKPRYEGRLGRVLLHYKVAKLHRDEGWSEEKQVDGTEYTWEGLVEGEEYKFRVAAWYDMYSMLVCGPAVETEWITTAVSPKTYRVMKSKFKLMEENLKSLRAENANLLESTNGALENKVANLQELMEEKSKLVHDQSSQIASLDQTVKSLEVMVREQEEMLTEKTQMMEEKSKKVSELKQALDEKCEDLECQEKELEHHKEILSKTTKEMEDYRSRMKDLQDSLNEKTKILDDLQVKTEELENTNCNLKLKSENEKMKLKMEIGELIFLKTKCAEMQEEAERWRVVRRDWERALMNLTEKHAALCEKMKKQEQKTLSGAVSDLIPYLSEIKDNQVSQIIPSLSGIQSTLSEQGQATADELDRMSQQIDNASVALDGSRTTRVATRGPKPIPDDLKNICMEITKSIGSQWRLFGRSLNLDGDALDEIGAMYEEHGEQEMVWGILEEWANRTENPSKVTLMKAIEDLGNPTLLDTPMSHSDMSKLQKHTNFLLQNIMELPLLASSMYQDEIITLQQLQQLLKCKTRLSGIQTLLVLLPSLGCRAFDSFCRALDSSEQRFITDVLLERHSEVAASGPTALNKSPADGQERSESAPVCTTQATHQSCDGMGEATASHARLGVFVSNFELLQAIEQVQRNIMSYMQNSLENVPKND